MLTYVNDNHGRAVTHEGADDHYKILYVNLNWCTHRLSRHPATGGKP